MAVAPRPGGKRTALVIARTAVAPRPGGKRTVPCLRRQAHRAMPAVALPPTAPPTLTYREETPPRRVRGAAITSGRRSSGDGVAGRRSSVESQPRGKHPDAQLQGPRRNLSPDVEAVVRRGTLVAQTPDGSCLFNSFAYCEQQDAGWLFGAATPASIRRQCAEWLQEHGNYVHNGLRIAKWIEHECGQQLSVKDYALQMQRCRGRVCWGGALEILAYSRLRSVNVAVWIPTDGRPKHFTLTSRFEVTGALTTVNLCRSQRMHYDVVELVGEPVTGGQERERRSAAAARKKEEEAQSQRLQVDAFMRSCCLVYAAP
ncbi:hypothetical protein EMIHUDRAFT_460476 [Emiliania huxleyi CCMP1516]|uniref:Ubiquitin thioesterase OTU n=2 Tax=Emiliania huxleyi TaxID=2903 RepID=A0A0D3KQ28_EMIH1|nr:hypothetical protein EMIHUDRAFT_460476 [Emiliania huxleyi CCMP1516]EOD37863.1 hypothetical protein EMIHUDRAFT_460476 [Emiliania huxleyi CCMP1516]|eukprot:XP_005790292.1 hypothetical protein EMIHUDRAFT_460476 [Emiliania huxleyi CCMP1516]